MNKREIKLSRKFQIMLHNLIDAQNKTNFLINIILKCNMSKIKNKPNKNKNISNFYIKIINYFKLFFIIKINFLFFILIIIHDFFL